MKVPNSLTGEIEGVASRFRRRALWQVQTSLWLILIAQLTTLYFAAPRAYAAGAGLQLVLIAIGAAACVVAFSFVRRVDLRRIAHRIEAKYPELETKLLAAYEHELKAQHGRRSFLEDELIKEARIHSLTHRRWFETVPTSELRTWAAAHWAVLAIAIVVLALQTLSLRRAEALEAASGETPAESLVAKKDAWKYEVEPGDVELERGSDLLVLARFTEPKRLPREAQLTAIESLAAASPTKGSASDEAEPKSDKPAEQKIPLVQSLSDPIFAARVPEVRADLTYRLTFDGETSRDYKVTVFDYPELERADAELNYPSYTGLPVRKIEDVRRLSVLEGSEVKLLCRLNKPVASAKLVPGEGDSLALEPTNDDATLYTMSQTVTKNVRWKLALVDEKGRKNRDEVEFVVEVTPNRPPDLKALFPRKDVAVSPLQELPLEAEASDDFGIVRWGLAYELTGKKPASLVLGEKLAGKEKRGGKHLLSLEDLKAVPDELLAWHVWAEDLGPDGKVRRTTSDIFFAEVSPFDEILREMEMNGGGMPGQPNPVDDVAKLQKEIISATWNLRRREAGEKPSAAYGSDAKVIAESQQKALDGLEKMKEKLRSPDALSIVAEIERQMQAAKSSLVKAADTATLPPLDEAIPSEQSAYQNLLKLRARETTIMRSKGGKGGGGGETAAGQKLDQLEMKEEESRYEKRNEAADPNETPAQREREEFLKRLRELAKRQEDLNDKIKELQAALDAAKTAEQKKEIERQLKRLRDEQREQLRNVDDLKNKLDKPEHNQPLAEESKKLEETRENIRQASDALEKGETPQALTAGARAETGLDKLREDFRKRTADRFGDEVRDLLDRAKQLDERQQAISKELGDGKPESRGSGLKPSGPTADGQGAQPKLAERVAEQQKELGGVLEQARELVERAEGNEPLLTKQLYDAIREANQQRVPQAADMLRQYTQLNMTREAKQVEPRVGEGMKQLRDKIEKASQGVLGNDVESLRRAKSEVDRLAQALGNELRREDPSGEPAPGDEGKSAAGEGSKEGESKNGDGAKSEEAKGDGAKSDGASSKKPGDAAEGKSGQGSGDKPDGKQGEEGRGDAPGQGDKPGEGKQPGGEGKGQEPGKGQGKGKGQAAEGKGKGKGEGQGQGEGEGKGQGQGKGQGEGEGQGKGQGKGKGQGEGVGEGEGRGKGQGKGKGQGEGKGIEGEGEGSGGEGSGASRSQTAGLRQGTPKPTEPGQKAKLGKPGDAQSGSPQSTSGNQTGTGSHGALVGPDWRDWSDALRNVEEFVPGTKLRTDAARVREQAQAIRAEMKRHSKNPNWDLVREKVYEPLVELQKQLDEELARRESPEAAVPLDRDPVPDRFGEAVRRYYERLGSGR